jgi:hypothetical protein
MARTLGRRRSRSKRKNTHLFFIFLPSRNEKSTNRKFGKSRKKSQEASAPNRLLGDFPLKMETFPPASRATDSAPS